MWRSEWQQAAWIYAAAPQKQIWECQHFYDHFSLSLSLFFFVKHIATTLTLLCLKVQLVNTSDYSASTNAHFASIFPARVIKVIPGWWFIFPTEAFQTVESSILAQAASCCCWSGPAWTSESVFQSLEDRCWPEQYGDHTHTDAFLLFWH